MVVHADPFGDDVLYATGTAKITLQGSSGVHIETGVDPIANKAPQTNATINMTNTSGTVIRTVGGHIQINASGVNELNLGFVTRGAPSQINVHNTGTLVGGMSGFSGTTRIDGGQFYNIDSIAGRDGQTVIINSDVIGTGVFHQQSFHGGVARLEFMQSVGEGQTISMEPGGGSYNLLQIDDPQEFQARINFADDSIIDLPRLAADSYTVYNDLLTGSQTVLLFKNSRTVAALDTHLGAPIAVTQNTSTGAAGVEIRSVGADIRDANLPHSAIALHPV